MTTIRPASTSDAAALTVIAQTAKRHWGYPEPWLEAWAAVLTITPEYVQGNTVFVAERDGLPVAFVGLVDGSTYWQLDHLWVLPEHQGHGLGSRLFDAALGVVRARRPGVLRIEAEPFALGFYERCGARQVGTVPAPVLGTPRELPLLELAVTPT
ncbi:MAG TPA: GNAT family N-acetyltransferase [Thermoanaerobaculia bacterium]|jgi:GNAT superfamily N-acetyltransferase|nr:GNAT family N-acetyltransferase [Thermoanaerobaculia bacterium]